MDADIAIQTENAGSVGPSGPTGSASLAAMLAPHQASRQFSRYDTNSGGHYGACVTLASQGYAPAELYTGCWANVHQGLDGSYKDILTTYWQQMITHLEHENHDYKVHQLPLARIKKVMKADPDVKMISAEAPILFAKGCDIFITELTLRAWIHAEENKRRTLQRSDIASALAKSDMFDFLIDIVPREEASPHAKRAAAQTAAAATATAAAQSASGSASQIPGSLAQPGAAMPGDYNLGPHGLAGEADYRQASGMYPPQVQPPSAAPYNQNQGPMYGEMDSMYQYSISGQQAPLPSEEFE